MSDFTINFSYPWLLLLLIPAVLVSLIPYFRLKKRYRRTRNRITSLILHTSVMVLAIMLLCGMSFSYTIPNTANELILLVDVSDTEGYSKTERDRYVADILTNTNIDDYSVGVVTFGFDQVYAVELTKNTQSVYDDYLNAELPDTSATDIAAAIKYAATLFKNPDSGKIVLVTDGLETDEDALTAIKYVTSQNTKLDVVYVPSVFEDNDVQLVDVEFPEQNVSVDEEFTITVSFYSNYKINASITMADNGVVSEERGTEYVDIQYGVNTCVFTHKFTTTGLHKLDFSIDSRTDAIEDNNVFSTYYNLQIFDRVLLVSRGQEHIDESEFLESILSKEKDANNKYTVTSTYIGAEDFPATIDELRNYDQIILNNIANSDLQEYEGLDDALYEYVYTYGGGLFTVGGSDGTTENYQGQEVPDAHAYSKKDMYGTKYQEMLPVEIIDYTPPAGVIFIVDRSGSMNSSSGNSESEGTRYEWAKAGIWAGVLALEERDYVGIMTMGAYGQIVLPLTPRPQESVIKEGIANMPVPTGGTTYCDALRMACQQLAANDAVERRHIVMITDGQIGSTEQAEFERIAQENFETNGITLSLVLVGVSAPTQNSFVEGLLDGSITITAGEDSSSLDTYSRILRAVWLGNDTAAIANNTTATIAKRRSVISKLHVLSNPSEITKDIKDELESPQIKEVELAEYYPLIAQLTSPLLNGVRDGEGDDIDKVTAKLIGFYGAKLRASAEVILTAGESNAPLYAQWQFGKGKVGSFMADLSGEFTADFIASEKGKRFIQNVVDALMATDYIRKTEIEATLTEENYINRLDVISTIDEGEKIVGTISWTEENGNKVSVSLNDVPETANPDVYVTSPLTKTNNYARCIFVVKKTGVYTIELHKVDKDGNPSPEYTMYKTFSYSTEYDEANKDSAEDTITQLKYLAEGGSGVYIDSINLTDQVFASFVEELFRTFDPRVLFAILIIVMFLLDIAVRKFKFKWPHEIIRDRKNKKFKNFNKKGK